MVRVRVRVRARVRVRVRRCGSATVFGLRGVSMTALKGRACSGGSRPCSAPSEVVAVVSSSLSAVDLLLTATTTTTTTTDRGVRAWPSST